MTRNLPLLAACFGTVLLFSCEEEPDTTACINLATVDRESAPDCGIVLSLDGGGEVIPSWTYGWCGNSADDDYVDSLQNLIQHGDRVRFGYSIKEYIEPCRGIPYTYVTCLEVLTHAEPDIPIR